MKAFPLLAAICLVGAINPGFCADSVPLPGRPALQRFGTKGEASATAVRVADAPLIFTAQIYSPDAKKPAVQQATNALDEIAALLGRCGSQDRAVVRLTAYAADDEAAQACRRTVQERFRDAPPAFTLIRTTLPRAAARIAFEAVAVGSARTDPVKPSALAAVLPAGGKIFISGQAVKGASLAEGTRLTMAGLHRTLAHLGVAKADVVQVKAFLRPMEDAAAAEREIVGSFDGKAPPIVLIAWQGEQFTEIEVVAALRARATTASEPLSFVALPWLTKSPRFSHVVQVAPGVPLIFIGDVSAPTAGDARAQVEAAFGAVAHALFESGASFRTLAKATYYVGDAGARTVLNDIRSVYFDPNRAPAASAVPEIAPGRAGTLFSMDLIAAPAER